MLTVPATVQEGETFLPQLTISQEVLANFSLLSVAITATLFSDFPLYALEVQFTETNLTVPAPFPFNTTADDLVEPDETVKIQVNLSAPSSIRNLVEYANQEETVTIVDSNSKYMCACHCTSRSLGKKYLCIIILIVCIYI